MAWKAFPQYQENTLLHPLISDKNQTSTTYASKTTDPYTHTHANNYLIIHLTN
jgi:hypothetical protein